MNLRSIILLMALSSLFSRAFADTIEVTFKITDLDYRPLPGVAARVVIGESENWQNPDAGVRLVTDAKGEHRFTVTAPVVRHLKKRPTNFVSSLIRRPETADHVQLAAELEYGGYHWLHVFQIDRFTADGTVLHDGYTFYTRDAQGRFTVRAVAHERDWSIADLGTLRLTGAPVDLWDFRLEPVEENTAESDGQRRWKLEFGLKRGPDPVRRD